MQLRAEFFNILNHTNFAPPLSNNAVFNATGVRVRDYPITLEKVLPGLPKQV